MKIRTILNEKEKEMIVLSENGGIVCIREAEDISDSEKRTAITDYYQMRLTEVPQLQKDNLFDFLAEGKMYHKDWATSKYNSVEALLDALAWLGLPSTVEFSEDVFTEFFETKLS